MQAGALSNIQAVVLPKKTQKPVGSKEQADHVLFHRLTESATMNVITALLMATPKRIVDHRMCRSTGCQLRVCVQYCCVWRGYREER